MGSGETAPTMVKVHRAVRDRLGPDASGVLLDTPYGFQRNADDLSARAVAYFRDSVGMTMTPADVRTSADLEGQQGASITARMAAAPLLFSGPGSPSYALRQWAGTLVPGLLAEKLALGGAVTFASAAALTLGALTVPVYEIYKVGETPRWLEGLDLLSKVGIPAVVIPHYDNAEGGTHDTRYCYLGEERLELLEKEIPDGVFILGVDEHTAITFDLDSGEAIIAGNSRVTVRVKGASCILEAGVVVPTAHLLELAAGLASGTNERSSEGEPSRAADSAVGAGVGTGYSTGSTQTEATGAEASGTPLLQAVRRYEASFRDAKAAGDAAGMVAAALDLNDELWSWVADPNQSDELDRGRGALRSMLVELGGLAAEALKDPAELYGPFVELLVQNRNLAREERRFADADALRDSLAALGIEIHDTPEGSTWERP
jgi:hypothetical protein